jgi:hypothetical protein
VVSKSSISNCRSRAANVKYNSAYTKLFSEFSVSTDASLERSCRAVALEMKSLLDPKALSASPGEGNKISVETAALLLCLDPPLWDKLLRIWEYIRIHVNEIN